MIRLDQRICSLTLVLLKLVGAVEQHLNGMMTWNHLKSESNQSHWISGSGEAA